MNRGQVPEIPGFALTGTSPVMTTVAVCQDSKGSDEFVEQCFRVFKIGRVEALCEPAVDRREKIAGLGAPALVTAQPGEAYGGAQFPELGILLSSDSQGFVIQCLCHFGMALPQQQLALVPVQLRL